VCGGVAALCGAVLLGPRIGKYDSQGRAVAIPGHSVPVSIIVLYNIFFINFINYNFHSFLNDITWNQH